MCFRLDRGFLYKLYRKFFLETGFFCPVCMRGMGVAIGSIQLSFRIPLSLSGTSRRTEEHVDQRFFLDDKLNFLENVLSEVGIDADEQFLLRPIGIFRSPPAIKLPDFLDWDYSKIYHTITTELGWTSPEKNVEHTDCNVEPVVQYIRYRKFPDITPEVLRFSKLVTCGQMTRSEAITHIEKAKKKAGRPHELKSFFDKLGITEKEFEEVLASPMRHLKYLKKRSAVIRRIKALKQFVLPY